MKLILNIIKYIFLVFFGMLLFSILSLFIQKKFNLNSYPNILGYSVLNVKSGSMSSTFTKGDYILTKKASSKDVKVNDIVVYKDSSYYVTHRLISIDSEEYETMGDANNKSEIIDGSSIVGKVVYYSRKFSFFMSLLKNPVFLVLLCLITLVIPDIIINNYKKDMS